MGHAGACTACVHQGIAFQVHTTFKEELPLYVSQKQSLVFRSEAAFDASTSTCELEVC